MAVLCGQAFGALYTGAFCHYVYPLYPILTKWCDKEPLSPSTFLPPSFPAVPHPAFFIHAEHDG
jgi:hypothetical protein